MSSFTICKKEYVKAAGLVAGIASVKVGWREFFLYDYEKCRRMTEADIYEKFCECFKMNALSVQEQYKDKSPELDDKEYMDVFKEARQRGVKAARSGETKDVMIQLNDFFRSAIYQTEKDAYMWKMTMFFDSIIIQMIEFAFPHECESWGTLNA